VFATPAADLITRLSQRTTVTLRDSCRGTDVSPPSDTRLAVACMYLFAILKAQSTQEASQRALQLIIALRPDKHVATAAKHRRLLNYPDASGASECSNIEPNAR
jgi:hypothetical protein